jgi:hypothetical protein
MKQRVSIILACIAIGVFSNAHAWTDRVQIGAGAGIGFPQIPLSRFRTPVSVLGTASLRVRPFGRYFLKTEASALTSFKTGTVNGRDGTMRYNLQYATVAAGREFKRHREASVILFLGAGRYRVDRQIDQTVEDRETGGVNAGFEFLNDRPSFDTFFTLNWHLLFEPGSNSQLLTLTFGFLF